MGYFHLYRVSNVISTKNEFRIDHRFGDGGGDCVYAKLSMGGFQ